MSFFDEFVLYAITKAPLNMPDKHSKQVFTGAPPTVMH